MSSSLTSVNDKIINTLEIVFNSVDDSNTFQFAVDNLQSLIVDNADNDKSLSFIFQQINNHLLNLKSNAKHTVVSLIPFVIRTNPPKIEKFIDKIIILFENAICDDNSKVFPIISKNFGDVARLLIINENSDVFNAMKNFCFSNIKGNAKSHQIIGALCLTALIENSSAMIAQKEILKSIWEIIIINITNKSYYAKLELLNCLISLIFISEDKFKPYASMTLYKIFDYITDEDWLKRKLSLNIVYTLIHYSSDEIAALKGYIKKFLKERSNDDNSEVRDVCLQTIKLLDSGSSHALSPRYDSGFYSDRSSMSNTSIKAKPKHKKTSSMTQMRKVDVNKAMRNYNSVTHANKKIETIRENIENRARTPSVQKKKREFIAERCSSAMGGRKNYNLLNRSGNKAKENNKNSMMNYNTNPLNDTFQKRIMIIKNRKKNSNTLSATKAKVNKSLSVNNSVNTKKISFALDTAKQSPMKTINVNKNEPKSETKIEEQQITQTETKTPVKEEEKKEEQTNEISSKIKEIQGEIEKLLKRSKTKEEIKKCIKMKNYEGAFKLAIEINSISKVTSTIRHFIINCSGEDNNVIFSYEILKSLLTFITSELFFITELNTVCIFIKEKIVDKKIRFDSIAFNKEVYNTFNKLLIKKDKLLLSKREIDNITAIVKYFSISNK